MKQTITTTKQCRVYIFCGNYCLVQIISYTLHVTCYVYNLKTGAEVLHSVFVLISKAYFKIWEAFSRNVNRGLVYVRFTFYSCENTAKYRETCVPGMCTMNSNTSLWVSNLWGVIRLSRGTQQQQKKLEGYRPLSNIMDVTRHPYWVILLLMTPVTVKSAWRLPMAWTSASSYSVAVHVIMDTMASQITNLTSIYSAVYISGADHRKHQSSASLAFVRGIHRSPVNSPHKEPVMRKMFPFDDVVMALIPNHNFPTAKHIDHLRW